MFQDMQNALDAMNRESDRLRAAIGELVRLFPGVANGLAWQDKIFTEQRRYLTGPKDAHDYQLEIAMNWVELAQKGRLQAAMDASGLTVTVLDSEALTHGDLETVLFKKLNELNELKWLMYPDLQAALQHRLGLSLNQHWNVFVAVVNNLSEKRYLRYEKLPNGMLRFNQGINFDEWRDMRAKPQPPSVTNNTFTFNDQVGAVQTGANSVAKVQQAVGTTPYADLKAALQLLAQELATSELEESKRKSTKEIIDRTVREIDSESPSKDVLKLMCSGLATTVQTLGSASAAYQAVAAAFAVFGISLG
ncbi:hypothetical protein [Pseudomonas sp. RW10S2]|uniref:hypothetical protein n=1 Tax=Pseudomonas sp. RW10S2 TaxID=459637 RepID=UPI0016480CC4|nr:hypothetical protein [Pseudomonas sp. RW10S2]MBC3467256.1 hypothetical protein [Pseudomonas sp. RW10S2]